MKRKRPGVAAGGGKLKIVAYLHDTVAIKQILDHLGLNPPEEAQPPAGSVSVWSVG